MIASVGLAQQGGDQFFELLDFQQERIMTEDAVEFQVGDMSARFQHGTDNLATLAGREQPVAAVGRNKKSSIGPTKGFAQLAEPLSQIKVIHGAGQIEIAVRIKSLDKPFALIMQVAFDLEFRLALQVVREMITMLQITTKFSFD